MEQQQRSLFFTAAVGLIILSIIVGSVYYLVKFIQSRVISSRQAPQSQAETVEKNSASPAGESVQGEQTSGASPRSIPQTGDIAPDKKIYNAGVFQISYPKQWGILTCNNSLHFELDPSSSVDNKVECNSASKPITILVDNINKCEGDNVKIGNFQVIKSKKVDGSYTAYQWCTKTNPVLNITHRVSKEVEKAVSPNDYSGQIEEIISTLTFSSGS